VDFTWKDLRSGNFGFFTWLRLPEHLDAMALRSAVAHASFG
jgi:DNA-binding transcriptional MocR family regulator